MRSKSKQKDFRNNCFLKILNWPIKYFRFLQTKKENQNIIVSLLKILKYQKQLQSTINHPSTRIKKSN